MSTKAISGNVSAKKVDIKKLTVLAMFAALGYIALFVFRFKVQFLTLDFKDVFITMAGFAFGPLAALGVAFAEAAVEMVTLSDTAFLGALMNFAGSAAFACTASLIYKYNKSFKGAVLGLVAAVFSMTAVMLLMNLLITPIYMHVEVKMVIGMIPSLLMPFNLVKSVLNAAICFMLYKPISQALKSIKLLPKSDDSFKFGKNTVIGLIVAAAVVAASVFVIFELLGGNFMMTK